MQKAATIAVPDGRPSTSLDGPTSSLKKNQPHAGRRRRVRSVLVALLMLAVLAPMYAARPESALAGSCTGWRSINVPPDTIRVGRNDGSVDVVDFRKYVGTVMAMEWPYWLPKAALEVGAVAVKQYAWYWSLAGHHRGFVNSRGKCFDVYDSTRDQLYKPEKVSVRRTIWGAVDRTWDLSLRKNGRFFMTGYRYGSDVRCGRDADGWKVYERSVVDCAKRGKSSREIQLRYLSPGLTFHVGGAKVTTVSTPKPTPRPTAKPTPRPTAKPTPSPTPSPLSLLPANHDEEWNADLVMPPSEIDFGYGALEPSYAPLWLPEAAADDWAYLCLTSVGPFPAGRFAVLAELPPPFGCAPPEPDGLADVEDIAATSPPESLTDLAP